MSDFAQPIASALKYTRHSPEARYEAGTDEVIVQDLIDVLKTVIAERDAEEQERVRWTNIAADFAKEADALRTKLQEVVKAADQCVGFAPEEFRAWYDDITKDLRNE